jgi:hypothetical protein
VDAWRWEAHWETIDRLMAIEEQEREVDAIRQRRAMPTDPKRLKGIDTALSWVRAHGRRHLNHRRR